jgi:hypothetical protein
MNPLATITITYLFWTLSMSVEANDASYPVEEWARQFGTSNQIDVANGLSVDAVGGVYVSGSTSGDLDGQNAGRTDAIVRKYNAGGNLEWATQFGTTDNDEAFGVGNDTQGNLYVTGFTYGNLDGANTGLSDVFLRKYNETGTLQWATQVGSEQTDASYSISVNTLGDIFISGATDGNLVGTNAGGWDAFVSRYSADGNHVWTRQLGTPQDDLSFSVSSNTSGDVFIAGYTAGNLSGTNAGSYDSFLAKYTRDGTLDWTRQLGTQDIDELDAVYTDENNAVYAVGSTFGGLAGANSGLNDAYIVKYDSAGNLEWTRQLGTPGYDGGRDVWVDKQGNAYASGFTTGDLAGINAGEIDAFIAKYDGNGVLIWSQQWGSNDGEFANGIAADGKGAIYVSGYSYDGALGPLIENWSAVLVKFQEVPEPIVLIHIPSAILCVTLTCRVGRVDRRQRHQYPTHA